MEKFLKHKGLVAPLDRADVDTDAIIPKQFLKRIERTGFGQFLFFDHRFRDDGSLNPDFILNRPEYDGASILVAGRNFGTGSSREHAPWALLDYGFKCIIAPSFADIFYNNCFKNGILPITLPQEEVDRLMDDAERGANATLTVDLETQTITEASSEEGNGGSISFEIDPFNKQCLLEGHDDIALTLKREDKIEDFEVGQKQSQPWQWIGQTQEGET